MSATNKALGSGRWTIALWIVQIILALFYGWAAFMKLTMAPPALVGMGLTYATDIPHGLLLFIGSCELAGATGLILPSLLRIKPSLTPLAAAGLSAIQLLAIPFHLSRGEAQVLPMNFVLLALSLLIIWGRTKRAPIAPKA